MPQPLSLRLDATPRSHGWSLLSAMIQPRKRGIRNWFVLTEALCCVMGCLWYMLDKTYALKYTHTPPWWVKDIQEASQSLMQELRILLSLIPVWWINNSRVVLPVQEGSKLPLQIYSTCLPGQCLCLFLDHQRKCWKIRTERWSGRKVSTLHLNPIRWIPAHINCFTPQLVSSH